ncbi:MAG: hypothetical protein IRY99_13430 [Isosphaeraceae bacterium]|nr:hypothetical protein [Isosphaeraceae bacterium]
MSRRRWIGSGVWALALVAIGWIAPARSYQGMLTPRPTPQGGWAEVIAATPKWLVFQNAEGQQFPVSLTGQEVGLFVIRWPTSPERISPRALVEVTGIALGNNMVRTDHVDVYEPDAQGLVAPTPFPIRIVGFNRIAAAYYGADWNAVINGQNFVWPSPEEQRIPDRLHMVAPVANPAPLQLAMANNNLLTVLPLPAGMSMARITPGSASLVRPGDLVYFLPRGVTAKSLVIDQMVVYKPMPVEEFVP